MVRQFRSGFQQGRVIYTWREPQWFIKPSTHKVLPCFTCLQVKTRIKFLHQKENILTNRLALLEDAEEHITAILNILESVSNTNFRHMKC